VSHDTPKWAAKIILDAGGKNPRGDSLYRLIWGANRLSWVGGKWIDRDPNTKEVIRRVIEVRQFPKYSHLGMNKWYVERWYPPEHFGSRARWEALTFENEDGIRVAALGPYPENGDYDHFYTMEGEDGEYRALTHGRVNWVASVIRTSEAAYQERVRAMREAAKSHLELEFNLTPSQLREKQEADAAPDAEDLALLRDRQKPFGNEPMIVVP
jgi:hypothetical protein